MLNMYSNYILIFNGYQGWFLSIIQVNLFNSCKQRLDIHNEGMRKKVQDVYCNLATVSAWENCSGSALKIKLWALPAWTNVSGGHRTCLSLPPPHLSLKTFTSRTLIEIWRTPYIYFPIFTDLHYCRGHYLSCIRLPTTISQALIDPSIGNYHRGVSVLVLRWISYLLRMCIVTQS